MLFRGRERDQIRARILFPFTLVILFVIAAFVIAAYIHEDLDHEQDLTSRVAAVERLFRQGLEMDSSLMYAVLTALARDEGIKKAFLEGNREALLKHAWPIFNKLRNSNRITHFYFTGPDRVNFLRVHQPNRYGDVINRITTLRAPEEKEGARGIELGPLGTLTLRVVVPWYDGDKLIGYLELGEEIDYITDEVHRILEVDLLVLVHEEFLDPQLWKSGRKMLGHQQDWDRFGPTLVVGRAMEAIPKSLIGFLDQGEQRYDKVLRMVESGRALYAAFLPLTDISGVEVGNIIVIQDVTSLRASFHNTITLVAILSLLVGGIVFGIFYVILSRVERDYRRQHEVEIQLSRVNTEYQKLIQVEKLSAMGLMVSEIAHQLNNPLAGVINMAQLAERETGNSERTKELLIQIRLAGKDCHAFVGRMLGFTKISCFDHKPTDLNRLIQETISLFQESSGIDSKIECDLPGDGPTLDLDPILIRHALFNLLTNAAQANPPDGTINVTLVAEARQQGRAPGWCLSVRDEGPGLADAVQNKIFTPFFTTRAEGTGLGLPVVQHVAILHEGEITGTNAKNGGAYFSLWLPDTRKIE